MSEQMIVEYYPNADFSPFTVGNLASLPGIPLTDLVAFYRLKESVAISSKNLALINAPSELTESGSVSFDNPLFAASTNNANGFLTPHNATESFFAFAVTKRPASSSFGLVSTAKSSTVWSTSTPGDRGISFVDCYTTLARSSIPYYDGEDGDWSSLNADASLGGAGSDDWIMIAGSYDAATRTLKAYTPHVQVVSSQQHPEGTVIDLRGTPRAIRIMRTLATSGGAARVCACAGIYSGVPADRVVFNSIYPEIKEYMAEEGITIL